MKRIIIEERQISGIPVMTIFPERRSPLPVVIYLHGFGGDKSSGLEYGYKLAGQGVGFLAFDCRLHGERVREPLSALKFERVYPENAGLDTYILMHEVIESAVEDFERLLSGLKSDERLDMERLGVTGFSMGAFAAFLIAATCSRVRVAVPIGGKPAFRKAWDDIVLATATYGEWRQAMAEQAEASAERSAYLRTIDPFDRLEKFAPKPLLMINGERDLDQPFHYALELYKKLLPLYQGREENLRLSLPPAGHELTPEMLGEACEWFKRYL